MHLFYNEHLDLEQLNIISVFELLPPGPISNITTLHPMIWDGGLMALLAQNNFDKVYYTKNNIHSFHLSMISGNRDEAWPMYLVWPISERFMLGQSGGTWPACCHWPNTGRVDARCPIMSVLTQSYQCGTWFVCSIVREQSRSTTVLSINHVIQMPQCLSGFVNHDYSISILFTMIFTATHIRIALLCILYFIKFIKACFPNF